MPALINSSCIDREEEEENKKQNHPQKIMIIIRQNIFSETLRGTVV